MPKPILHQIHPILPVKDVVEALAFYVKKLGFKIAFADDSKNPTYAGIRRDGIEIHLQWHAPIAWESGFNTPMLRIVTEHIENLYQEFLFRDVFQDEIKIKVTEWNTKEFAFFDIYNNGLTFYQNL
jgi:catechol 2,3-dioxygenase-like lactoylglutathione lyase family enzyme